MLLAIANLPFAACSGAPVGTTITNVRILDGGGLVLAPGFIHTFAKVGPSVNVAYAGGTACNDA